MMFRREWRATDVQMNMFEHEGEKGEEDKEDKQQVRGKAEK